MASSFNVGDRVFAKLKGYPFWPARVEPPYHTDPKGKIRVMFYGSFEIGFCLPKLLIPFTQASLEKHGSHSKREAFNEAMYQIQNEPNAGKLPDSTDDDQDVDTQQVSDELTCAPVTPVPERGSVKRKHASATTSKKKPAKKARTEHKKKTSMITTETASESSDDEVLAHLVTPNKAVEAGPTKPKAARKKSTADAKELEEEKLSRAKAKLAALQARQKRAARRTKDEESTDATPDTSASMAPSAEMAAAPATPKLKLKLKATNESWTVDPVADQESDSAKSSDSEELDLETDEEDEKSQENTPKNEGQSRSSPIAPTENIQAPPTYSVYQQSNLDSTASEPEESKPETSPRHSARLSKPDTTNTDIFAADSTSDEEAPAEVKRRTSPAKTKAGKRRSSTTETRRDYREAKEEFSDVEKSVGDIDICDDKPGASGVQTAKDTPEQKKEVIRHEEPREASKSPVDGDGNESSPPSDPEQHHRESDETREARAPGPMAKQMMHMRHLECEIKRSLQRGNYDFPRCIAALSQLNSYDGYTRIGLLRRPQTILTIRQCRRFCARDDIKELADKVYNRISTAFGTEGLHANEQFLPHYTREALRYFAQRPQMLVADAQEEGQIMKSLTILIKQSQSAAQAAKTPQSQVKTECKHKRDIKAPAEPVPPIPIVPPQPVMAIPPPPPKLTKPSRLQKTPQRQPGMARPSEVAASVRSPPHPHMPSGIGTMRKDIVDVDEFE